MARENLSPHTIVISELWKNLPRSEPARLTRAKAHWLQEPVGTVDNTDTRLRETLTAFRPLRPATGRKLPLKPFLEHSSCYCLLQSEPVHGALPPPLTINYMLTLRRSKRSSSGCLFSMKSWRFLNTCRKRKPVTSGTQTRQHQVAVIHKEAALPGSHLNSFQATVMMLDVTSQQGKTLISQYNACVEGSSPATRVLSIQCPFSSSFRSRLQETWFCSGLAA